tara:strand:- start:599 stop:1066 length:468 start_codon:yes stop_codon:yes gene_type:complete
MNIRFRTKEQHDKELERLDNIIMNHWRHNGLKNEGYLNNYDVQYFIKGAISRKNDILFTDLNNHYTLMTKQLDRFISVYRRRSQVRKAQSKYRRDKLGCIPRDPNFIPLTKAQQNGNYARTVNGAKALREAKRRYHIRNYKPVKSKPNKVLDLRW